MSVDPNDLHRCGDEDGAAWGDRLPPVAEILAAVVAQRGLDFEPPPEAALAALDEVARMVGMQLEGLPEAQERRWLAAGLAALAHRVELSSLLESVLNPPEWGSRKAQPTDC